MPSSPAGARRPPPSSARSRCGCGSALRRGDLVLVEAGDTIPADGEIVEGIASVNESAVTGESAPVIRESGGGRSAVTGVTTVLSDWLVVRVTSDPGDAFLDRIIAMVEGARRSKTPNRTRCPALASAAFRFPEPPVSSACWHGSALRSSAGVPTTGDVLDAFVRQGAVAVERARLGEQARAAALRVRSEELRSSLLSAVSHDLRTPLAAITGAASALREEAPGAVSNERAELLDTIVEEAERLERLVANLLDMTRLDGGRIELRREWVPVEEIVGAALGRLEGRLAGREVRIDLPADLPLVAADPLLLEQLVLNLVENAIKYTPPRTPIEIAAAARGDWLELSVADRGPGLPRGQELRVFEKFFRGSHPGAPGVGLGLAICRGIAEAHGGRLSAESREGGGARFRLELPLDEAAPSAVPGAS